MIFASNPSNFKESTSERLWSRVDFSGLKRDETPMRWKESQATGPLALLIEDFVSGHFKNFPKKAVHFGPGFKQSC
jgi:hypothetical protein